MFWLKACPRCHGDLYREKDVFGSYVSCLQCAHELSLIEELYLDDPLGKVAVEEAEPALAQVP